ncbi:MAG: alpha/beta hydrolase [Prolixibacteraceae bacterium]|nr:alpha/beta hydrolase [Prolixibacteraceae bacterium]
MKTHIFFIAIFSINIMTNAQTRVISLWPDGVPGSIENSNFIETTDSLDNWIKTRFVTNPRLDFYRANKELATGTAVVICPGGGYWGIAIDHEGKQTAEWLNSIGISAFVLKYRLPDDAIMEDKSVGPLQDAQRAMRIVRRRSKEFNINPGQIGIMGYSAGGHLASTISTHYDENVYEPEDNTSARPDFSILIYPVITMDASYTHLGSRETLLGKNPTAEQVKHFSNELQVNGQTPPAFLVHSLDDDAVPVLNSINYTLALRKNNVPCELHLYEQGGHGYGLGRSDNTESTWPEACKKWLGAHGLIK